jgi:hypothetical protein
MATDSAAPEPTMAQPAEEISALSVRVADLDAELARLGSRRRRRMGRAAYGIAAAGLSVVLFAVPFCMGFCFWASVLFLPNDATRRWGEFLTRNSVPVTWLIWLCGTSLAIIAGAVCFRSGWRGEQRWRMDYGRKRRHLTGQRDSALAELCAKQNELEQHGRVVGIKPGSGP